MSDQTVPTSIITAMERYVSDGRDKFVAEQADG